MRWTLPALATLALAPLAASQPLEAYLLEGPGNPVGLKEPGEAVEVQMSLVRNCPSNLRFMPATVAHLSSRADRFAIELPAEIRLPEHRCNSSPEQKVPFQARFLATHGTPRQEELPGTVHARVESSSIAILDPPGKAELDVAAVQPAALGPAESSTPAAASSHASPGPRLLVVAGLAVAAFALGRPRAPGQE